LIPKDERESDDDGMSPAIPFSMSEVSGFHADPVVPILLALVVLTLAAVFGGRLMTLIKQPPVLGELAAGLLIGNLAYWFGNAGITVLREGDALRRIADLALSSNVSLSEAALRLLPAGSHAERVSAILGGTKGLDYVAVYSFVDLLSRIAILVLLFLVGLSRFDLRGDRQEHRGRGRRPVFRSHPAGYGDDVADAAGLAVDVACKSVIRRFTSSLSWNLVSEKQF
jgi:hypothetical protein